MRCTGPETTQQQWDHQKHLSTDARLSSAMNCSGLFTVYITLSALRETGKANSDGLDLCLALLNIQPWFIYMKIDTFVHLIACVFAFNFYS